LKIFLPTVAYTALACLLAVSAPPICQAQSYTITTVAGGGNTGASGDSIGDGGPATSAYLLPTGVAVDSAGNLYIADPSNNIIRKVTTDGLISTIAGDAVGRTFGNSGDGGPATTALLNHPQDVALDSAGNLYISDTGNATIRMVSTAGIITTVAGPSGLAWPAGIAVDSTGALYIADRDANNVRKVTPDGAITTVAGCLVCLSLGDGGAATKAPLSMPFSVAVDSAGALYIADTLHFRIRKVSADGTITTVAGSDAASYSGDGGPATSAGLNIPKGVAVDGAGNLYIADTGDQRIRMVTPDGTITTIAGNGAQDALSMPGAMAVGAAGTLYFVDSSLVRLLTPTQ
jgi:sugar lactone lactonase YvrE